MQLRFERGTVCAIGPEPSVAGLPHAQWDSRTLEYRIPAFRASDAFVNHLVHAERPLWPQELCAGFRTPELRAYQQAAVSAWLSFDKRGVVSLPTGAGKTRVAVAVMAKLQLPTVVLCPTRALLAQWKSAIEPWYDGPIGVVGDGERTVEKVTVMTFESAYRCMDSVGDQFALLVADEVHHFGTGIRTEALEMCTAPYRLGLTATPPAPETEARARIQERIGPVVCEIGLDDLLGVYLADLDVIRLNVELSIPERAIYWPAVRAFSLQRQRFFRDRPGAEWRHFIGVLSRSHEGRRLIDDHLRALRLASFPLAKRERTLELLSLHRNEKVLVFTANVDDAYELSRLALAPAITAETSRAERDEVLDAFRVGRIRAMIAARVLNEGIDIPDARVAIVVGAAQGAREMVQRVGRVLRPAPNKRALVYELTTIGTTDDARARTRRRDLASGFAALA